MNAADGRVGRERHGCNQSRLIAGGVCRVAGGLTVLLVLGRAVAQAQVPAVPQDAIANIQARVTSGFTPGMVVGMINSTGATYYSYGVCSLDTGAAASEDSVFEIGSISKTFTCTLLSQLLLSGDMILTNPVQAYLPPDTRVPSRNGKVITLRHLATHRSGLPRMPTNFNPASILNPYADYTVQQMYDFLATYPLPRDPDASFEYSNFGMGLVGYVLALKTGSNYEALVAQRITQKLGMGDTGISLTARMATHLAYGHSGVVQVPNWDFGPAFVGAGALRSSARDLLHYIAANMGLVQSELYPAMTNAQAVLASAFTGSSIGLAWFTTPVAGDEIVWHDGATGGYRSFAGFSRNTKVGVVVLANSDFEVTDLGFHLLNASIPLQFLPQPLQTDLETLHSCVGRFQGADGSYFVIGFEHNHLTWAYSADGGVKFTLYPSGQRSFFTTIVDASATFQVDDQGLVTELIWTQSGVSLPYSKTPMPVLLGIHRAPNETQVTFTGDTGVNYVLEAASDLAHWMPVATNTIWTLPVIDKEPGNSRFYRLRRE